ncbi:hypothetical protein EGC76_11015 [Pseudidiomarina gelatinasegens]|uniref:Helicase/UvrB N-terminal domain-containing protein n=1 Tax=Pseudidiomarina gelatinasegens TaxID=2487740 RepID=A0A443YXY8_9GAMM|nr:DEAD/DEAH box helicase family protein [Pseudidiomarina gelatinasegens]RWU08869.1 hypothetical protein EGC76_11015 [Pseudidiomarina gelatinasegens]
MKLRRWQHECVELALSKYSLGDNAFFVHATPGAGKTNMAAALAAELINKNLIDHVICFSPSTAVSNSIKETFERILNRGMNGMLGDIGAVYTYQYLSTGQSKRFDILLSSRVFVVFDEIHHASGDNDACSGQVILATVL